MRKYVFIGLWSVLSSIFSCQVSAQNRKEQKVFRKIVKKFTPPNGIQLNDSLYLDATEISNIAWQEYQFYIQDSSDVFYNRQVADTSSWQIGEFFSEKKVEEISRIEKKSSLGMKGVISETKTLLSIDTMYHAPILTTIKDTILVLKQEIVEDNFGNKTTFTLDTDILEEQDFTLVRYKGIQSDSIAIKLAENRYRAPRPPYFSMYYEDPYYRYYPYVCVSFEQANDYCAWRSKVVTHEIQQKLSKYKKYKEYEIEYIFRLPTKNELRKAIAYNESYNLEIKSYQEVYPDSTTLKWMYIHSEMKKDFVSFEKETKEYYDEMLMPHIYKEGTPNQIIQLPKNVYFSRDKNTNFYNIIGNVAEMTNVKGEAIGGSYLHKQKDVDPQKIQQYKSSVPWLGFRCVCIVKIRKKE